MSWVKPYLLLVCFSATLSSLQAQDPIWSPDVANIVYTHCSGCHHAGGIGPFSLMSYSDAVAVGSQIPTAVQTRHMPPWPADPDYRHFANENVLTQGEIDALVQWVVNGAPFGDPTLEPDPPVFQPSGSILDQIDMTLAIPPYTLQSNTDEIRWYAFENTSTTPIYINKMEVVPGLDAWVHHCDISYDVTGQSLNNDNADPLSGFNSATGWPNVSQYMNAWQPGGDVIEYPTGWGVEVPPGADFVMEIHYGPGGIGEVDSTLINIEFAPSGSLRPVQVAWSLGQYSPTLLDGPFFLPANQISTFHQAYYVPNDRSYLAICPHMHWLGKSAKIWFISPQGDSIPLIDIPQWDFHWQRYYYFQTIQVIPGGSTIYSEVSYDNTLMNPNNPTVPPINVGLGGGTTTDEMILTFFIWANYQPGDEDIIIDSTIIAGIEEPDILSQYWNVFPVPANTEVQATWPPDLQVNAIHLFDVLGKEQVIAPSIRSQHASIDVSKLKAGSYLLQLRTNQGISSKWFIKDD